MEGDLRECGRPVSSDVIRFLAFDGEVERLRMRDEEASIAFNTISPVVGDEGRERNGGVWIGEERALYDAN